MNSVLECLQKIGPDWFGVIISFLCMGGSVIGAIFSWREKCQTKKSEEEAKKSAQRAEEYAKNADAMNQAAKKYYDLAVKGLKREEEKDKKEELKEKAKRFIAKEGMVGTNCVAQELKISKENAFYLLEEMAKVDKTITAAGQCRIEKIDSIMWGIKSK